VGAPLSCPLLSIFASTISLSKLWFLWRALGCLIEGLLQFVLQFSEMDGVVLGPGVQGFAAGELRKLGSSPGRSFSN